MSNKNEGYLVVFRNRCSLNITLHVTFNEFTLVVSALEKIIGKERVETLWKSCDNRAPFLSPLYVLFKM